MRTNVAVIALASLLGAAALLAVLGCGVTPGEQSYAYQAWNPPVKWAGANVGEETNLNAVMKQMRTTNLNLNDRLLFGTPQGIVDAAVQVSYLADEVTHYQPAVALDGPQEAASFRQKAFEVKDMAVEIAKAADAGQMANADGAYARMFLSCNECHRLYRGVRAPSEPLKIPEIETPPPSGTTPEGTPAPEGTAPTPSAPGTEGGEPLPTTP